MACGECFPQGKVIPSKPKAPLERKCSPSSVMMCWYKEPSRNIFLFALLQFSTIILSEAFPVLSNNLALDARISHCKYPFQEQNFFSSIRSHCIQQRRIDSSFLQAIKVTIRIVGRKSGGETWLEDGCNMYQTRLRANGIDVETEWHKNDAALVKGVQGDYEKRQCSVVLMDPLGKKYKSEKFSTEIYRWIEEGGSRLVMVIGGAEGLPSELKYPPNATTQPILLSLSDMTFTHQFARLMLIEQIYRASEIKKGSGYHK